MQALWNLSPFQALDHSHEKMACAKPHPFPMKDLLKRKRADSLESTAVAAGVDNAAPFKKLREAATVSTAPLAPSSPAPAPVQSESESQSQSTQSSQAPQSKQQDMPIASEMFCDASPPCDSVPTDAAEVNMSKLDKAREKIESTINLEILLRHNELRLIDQELAKCTVALEQLRRCQHIPYPGEPGSKATPYQASTGAAPSLEPPAGHSRPQHPAPWGVTDGPYSRHYRQWLIPDPTFDPVPLELLHQSTGGKAFTPTEGRASRNGFERTSFGSARSQRYSAASSHHALPSSYPQPKPQAGPLIIKRQLDGKMVKLVCVWCLKENVSSVQGFLNHCRIAHGQNLTSHEAAARVCGHIVGEEEDAAKPDVKVEKPGEKSTTALPPVPTPTTPASASTKDTLRDAAASVLVHPFITGSKPVREAVSAPVTAVSTPTAMFRQSDSAGPKSFSAPRPLPKLNIPDSQFPLVESAQTPHLSALFKRNGMGGNLGKLVASAKQRIDLNDVQTIDTPEDEDMPDAPAMTTADAGSRAPVPASGSAPKQPQTPSGTASMTGARKPTQTPAPIRTDQPPITRTVVPNSVASSFEPTWTPNASFMAQTRDSPASAGSSVFLRTPNEHAGSIASPELSPNTDAPGLVSDNDEDAEVSSDESESGDTANRGDRRRSLNVQVRGHGDAVEDQVVAGATEDTENDALTCAMQAPNPRPNVPSSTPAETAPVPGTKRKRGRPAKAKQSN